MSTKVTDSKAKGKIQFVQSHQTALDAGTYQVAIKQTVKIDKNGQTTNDEFRSNLTFVVQGDRFALQPQDIHAVFPPPGSLGDHSHVLPHVALKRSTLPWERLTQADGPQDVPWLALLLIHEDELPPENELPDQDNQSEANLTQPGSPKIVTLGDLEKSSSNNAIKWPGVTLETGQHKDDKVAVIDIPKRLLSKILPKTKDLSYLAHVRQTTGETTGQAKKAKKTEAKEEEKLAEPLAVVISNRLPKKDQSSTAYLVSLENRYDSGKFDYQDATDHELIRLVVLKSWSFACSEPEGNFTGLLKKLDKDTLKLPNQKSSEANSYLSKGYTLLPHYLRQGGKTFSWYHGPLTPGENKTSLALSQLSVRSADQLIAYNSNTGLFDISYAAAWQIGQLLALQDKQFAISLFNWKRANAQKLAQNNQQALFPHLFPAQAPNQTSDAVKNDFPPEINTWFEQLGLLSGLPFNYLVPDEQMLPSESIRFFWLDWFWVGCLLDGAFSIGRVQDSDIEQDSNHSPLTGTANQISGFIVRSEVVSGWPDLHIDGSDSFIDGDSPMLEGQKLKILRRDRISEDTLICLFDGAINTVDLSLKPEGLHFGFNNDGAGNLWRELRKLDGTEMSEWEIRPLPWHDEDQKVVNIADLAKQVKKKLTSKEKIDSRAAFTSAQFTLQMIQGAEKVRFSKAK